MKAKSSYYIGIDVGGTKILGGLIQDNGSVIARLKRPTPQGAKAKDIAQVICDLIKDIRSGQDEKINGIGLGVPGLVAPNFRDILITPNINLTRYPLQQEIRQYFRRPVFLANDVNCGLMAEQWLGAAQTARHIIGIFPGTGVGGAIIINGQIYTGAQGGAAEIGHMVIDYNSVYRHAGVQGSLEALASRSAVERRIREAVQAGRKTIVNELLNNDLSLIKSKVIAKALKREDPLVTEIIQDVCQVFGQACISLRHLLNPEVILFGGGLIEACGYVMLPRIREISKRDPFFKGIDRCSIVASQLEDDAVMLGAAKLAINSISSQAMQSKTHQPENEPD